MIPYNIEESTQFYNEVTKDLTWTWEQHSQQCREEWKPL